MLTIVDALSRAGTAVAALIAAWIAWKGLATWKDQLRGTIEYDLARRILRLVYRLRDATAAVRSSVMILDETPAPQVNGDPPTSREAVRHRAILTEYEKRCAPMFAVSSELRAEVVESEVLWGSELKARMGKLQILQHELVVEIRNYLVCCDPAASQPWKRTALRMQERSRDAMYDGLGDASDTFGAEYDQVIGEIENYLRPRLQK